MRLPFTRRREHHNIDKMKLWGSGQDIGDPVHAGVFVSQESALRLSVVWACIRLIASTLGALPADIVRKRDEIREPVDRPPRWIEVPNPESTWFEFAERCFESIEMDGNAFVLITARDFQGFPLELWTLNPRQVLVKRGLDGKLFFEWAGDQRFTRYGPDNPLGDVLHIRGLTAGGARGMSPIEFARQSIGLGLATEKFGAKFFGRGTTMPGVIQVPPSTPALSREHMELMREVWEAEHAGTDKAHRPGFLTGGATWQSLSLSNEDSQFIQTRAFQVEEIATRVFGVPPHMVGLMEKQTSFGTGVEQLSIHFFRYSLHARIKRFEEAMSTLLPRGQRLRLNERGMLRGDSKTETDVLQAQLQNGIINPNEWRALLDKPPRPGGDRYVIPLNWKVLGPDGTPEVEGSSSELTLEEITLALQKIYLSVDVVITQDEARQILNRYGVNLPARRQPVPTVTPTPDSTPNGEVPAEVTQP